MTGRLKLRNATEADRARIAEIVAESPGIEFPEDVFAWPTIETAVVEDESGTVIGVGCIWAVPEGHFAFSRTRTTPEARQEGMLALKSAAERTLERLGLPMMRCPAAPYLSKMLEWAKTLPGMVQDQRVHMSLLAANREESPCPSE